MIKADQSLGDQPFCRFEERLGRCVVAIGEASRQTRKRCPYAPISSPWPILIEQANMARKAGALLFVQVSPVLTLWRLWQAPVPLAFPWSRTQISWEVITFPQTVRLRFCLVSYKGWPAPTSPFIQLMD